LLNDPRSGLVHVFPLAGRLLFGGFLLCRLYRFLLHDRMITHLNGQIPEGYNSNCTTTQSLLGGEASWPENNLGMS
jgi:hypothetical protein